MADEKKCDPINISGFFQLGVGQFPPQPCGDPIPDPIRCSNVPIIGHFGDTIENPVCDKEFYARALSGTVSSFNGTVGTTPVVIQFPTRFNRVIIINDTHVSGLNATLAIAFSSNPAINGNNYPGLTSLAQFGDNAYTYSDESRTFEVWSDTITVVSDVALSFLRLSVFFP